MLFRNLCYDGFTTYGTFYEGIRGIKGEASVIEEGQNELRVRLGPGEWDCWKKVRDRIEKIIFKGGRANNDEERELSFLKELWEKIEEVFNQKEEIDNKVRKALGNAWREHKKKLDEDISIGTSGLYKGEKVTKYGFIEREYSDAIWGLWTETIIDKKITGGVSVTANLEDIQETIKGTRGARLK